MKAIILAGGSGTRLWPLSRKNFPKQFLKLNEDKSLLQQTVKRILKVMLPEDILVITNNDYKFHVRSDLMSLDTSLPSTTPHFHIILEPIAKNTAPAIALGIKYCMEKIGSPEDEVIFVSPSDHIIKPIEKFTEYIKLANKIAKKGHIVTFGVKPTRPETGYGYIKVSDFKRRTDMQDYFFKVDKFTEKPDEGKAKKYIESGNYFWNSGMFAFTIGSILEEFNKYMPPIGKMLNKNLDEVMSNFKKMPEISIDYAIMEKSKKIVTIPMELYWNDIGSWDSLYDVLEKDKEGNVKKGDIITINTKRSMILGDKRHISTIGLEDCLIVETDDAILISKKGETQKVKDVVSRLKKNKRKEIEEHLTSYRPWGSYTILEEGPRYKIKRIVVNPKEKLSLQMHYHRSEHWVVVKGTAKVRIGDKEIFIHENESAYVPKSTLHRLENPGKVPVEIIEVQNGEYVEEDDIVRFDDRYGRNKED